MVGGILTRSIFMVVIWTTPLLLLSQGKDLSYYLPDIEYDQKITRPDQYFGFEIGEWHLSHDQLVGYCKHIALQSEKVEVEITGKTHEDRQLMVLHISNRDNLENKEDIKAAHAQLTDSNRSHEVNIENLPAVLYQGYSVHGNESSGANAVPLVLYYLAAGKSDHLDQLLNEVYILLDPCYNPDGVQRYSTWVNAHKSMSKVSDPNAREFNEIWPGGRTNHYWFDLNRDWLLLTHPESESRMKTFHTWKPNVLTDHHEMGTNSTFFFQPGVPSRTNPNTPEENQVLTERIGEYHAKALDSIGSQYFTKERYDDFYYGKGSTYPDIHGSIGILFEQASSRGHAQESENGLLTFPFTIRNQVVTSLSTQKATLELRNELLNFKKSFYIAKNKEALESNVQAYTFSDSDLAKVSRFIDILLQHDIEVYQIRESSNIPKFYIPTYQRQAGLVKTIFETVTTFKDSVFYDVSTWTMPLAFNIDYTVLDKKTNKKFDLEPIFDTQYLRSGALVKVNQPYAWIFDWSQHDAPKVLLHLLQNDINVKQSQIPLEFNINGKTKRFEKGTVIIPAANQSLTINEIRSMLDSLIQNGFTTVYELNSGYGSGGISIGNPNIFNVKKKNVFTIVGSGIRSYDVGEVWHFFDQVMQYPISLIERDQIGSADLSRYSTLVLADGRYQDFSANQISKIKDWVNDGGEILAMRRALTFLKENGMVNLETKEASKDKRVHIFRQYQAAQNNQGSSILGGAIFNADIDLSHPLATGYQNKEISLFRKGTTFYNLPKNELAAPLRYGDRNALQSGYVPRGVTDIAHGAPSATLHKFGKGRIVCFSDNLLFRGYWWGTHRLFTNALFFLDIIDGDAFIKYRK